LNFRVLDKLGRIVIPKKVREELCIKAGDNIKIEILNGMLTLSKVSKICVFCAREVKVTKIKNKYVCSDCVQGLSLNK